MKISRYGTQLNANISFIRDISFSNAGFGNYMYTVINCLTTTVNGYPRYNGFVFRDTFSTIYSFRVRNCQNRSERVHRWPLKFLRVVRNGTEERKRKKKEKKRKIYGRANGWPLNATPKQFDAKRSFRDVGLKRFSNVSSTTEERKD